MLIKDKTGDFKSLQEIVSEVMDNNPQHAQDLVDALSKQSVLSPNQDRKFCELIYGIKEKHPSVNIDINAHLKKHLGITQKDRKPHKVGPYYMKNFYEKANNKQSSIQQNIISTTINNRNTNLI